MNSDPDKEVEEEVPLDDEPLELHPVPVIPISYEDSDDYAPFESDDTGSEETR